MKRLGLKDWKIRTKGTDRDAVPRCRVAHGLGARLEEQLQHAPHVVRRAAHDEVVGGFPPRLAQPLQVRFESARRGDERLRPHLAL